MSCSVRFHYERRLWGGVQGGLAAWGLFLPLTPNAQAAKGGEPAKAQLLRMAK